jgi:hypothetical protein
MWPGAKSCCSPDGHCKPRTPAQQNSSRECKQIAFDHQKPVDLHIELAMIDVVDIDLHLRPFELIERRHDTNPVEPSPPDLQLLNSTFLI